MKRRKQLTLFDDVRGTIAGQMARLGMTDEDVYTQAMLNKSTFFKRKAHPETFRLDELYRVMDCLEAEIKFPARY